MEYRGVSIPETIPSSRVVRFPRRIVWGLARPYFDSLLRQLTEENAALKTDLLATNNRISALEDRLSAAVGDESAGA